MSKIKKIMNILKNMGLTTLEMYIEPTRCKTLREEKTFMYLLHGTRPETVQSVKKHGLLLKMYKTRTKEEKDLALGTKPCLWFAYTYTGGRYQFGTGSKKDKKNVVYMLAKVYTDYLKYDSAAYKYFKDVPPKDLIWQDDKRFIKIIKEDLCMLYRVK